MYELTESYGKKSFHTWKKARTGSLCKTQTDPDLIALAREFADVAWPS